MTKNSKIARTIYAFKNQVNATRRDDGYKAFIVTRISRDAIKALEQWENPDQVDWIELVRQKYISELEQAPVLLKAYVKTFDSRVWKGDIDRLMDIIWCVEDALEGFLHEMGLLDTYRF